MNPIRILLIAGGVLVLIGLVVYFGLFSFVSSMCGASIVRRVPSPNRRLDAVIYEYDCGATTDFGTSLSIIKAGGEVGNNPGNLLVADSDNGRAPLDSGNVIRLSVQWIGSDSLVVRYDRRAQVFQQHPSAKGVGVQYIAVD